ncbi:phage head-tail connector protein [Turicimonas muris]|uniref:phage head-tail connector protein n=1 Tax=Turicimonas muris TaxID=1796652 RepID=UPI002605288C|nr:hypothetical protein [Turicimonas muris]
MKEDSILITIKGMLGIDKECDVYDRDLIIFINGAFSTLYQIGVGKSPMTIDDEYQEWSSVFSDNSELIDLIKNYTFLKVRTIFDPPASSFVLDAINKQINEYEWRIHVQAEGGFEK